MALFGKNGELLLKREANIGEKVPDANYESFVAALSSTLATLSREMADVISGAEKKTGNTE